MAEYTNVSRGLIQASNGVAMTPGVPVDVPDNVANNWLFKEYVRLGRIQKGAVEVKPEVEQDEPEELKETTTTKPQVSAAKTGNQKT